MFGIINFMGELSLDSEIKGSIIKIVQVFTSDHLFINFRVYSCRILERWKEGSGNRDKGRERGGGESGRERGGYMNVEFWTGGGSRHVAMHLCSCSPPLLRPFH